MNFYKHHIGDYAAATAHLSFVEDAAYSRLLRIYYRDEKPLPVDIKAVQRLAGARSKDEREAVETVLQEFFSASGGGWHSKRCDEEILKANIQATTNRRIAHDREARRRTRFVHESCNESLAFREPSQTPDSRLQKEQDQKIAPEGDLLKGIDPQVAKDFKALRAKQRAPITKTSLAGIEREAKAAGLTLDQALTVCCERNWRGFKAIWFDENPNGERNGSHRKLSAVERVRANALEGERAERAAAANGSQDIVGPHG